MKLPSDQRPTTLDDLFALKRAERPSPEFWDDFQKEFHVRQRAAAVEPKRWWFVLPRFAARLHRYQMPMGAAAVLAVTFLSFREYREPGLEVAFAPATPMVPQVAEREPAAPRTAEPSLDLETPAPTSDLAAVDSFHRDTPSTSLPSMEPLPLSPMVVWAGVDANNDEPVAEPASPSARSIAANLAAVRAEQPEIARLPGEPRINLTTTSQSAEPLAAIAVPNGSAREPLFAYQPAGSRQHQGSDLAEAPDVPSRIASRLSDELLYDTVRRLIAGGDRLTLKF